MDPVTLRELYWNRKMSLKEIARKYNRGYATIHYWMRKNKIPIRNFVSYNIPKERLKKLYIENRFGTTEISKIFGCDEETIRKKLIKFGITIRSNSESKTKYPKKDFDGSEQDKAYLVGFRCGDLSVRLANSIIVVSGTSTHVSFVKLVESCYARYGHTHVIRRIHRGLVESQLSCYLNISFSFLLEKLRCIPEWIMSDDDSFFHFLAGYTDAEGSWTILNNGKGGVKYRLYIGSQDLEILSGLRDKLEKLGFHPHLYLHCKKGTTLNYGTMQKDFYALVLCRNKEVKKLANLLITRSRHPEKIAKIRIVLSDFKDWTSAFASLERYRNDIKRYLLN